MSDMSHDNSDFSAERPGHLPSLEGVLQQFNGDIPDFSERVLGRLQADINSPIPCQYDAEFLSAYLDNALHAEFGDGVLLDHRIEIFERHLPGCDPCTRQLGLFSETRETYRSHVYRLEEQLETSWDIAPQIIARFEAEAARDKQLWDEAAPLPSPGCGQFAWDDFSASLDKELPGAAVKSLTAHTAGCEPCREAWERFRQAAGSVSGYYRRALAGGQPVLPNFWLRLVPELELQGRTSAARPGKKKPAIWVPLASIGTLAASVLLMFNLGQQLPGLFQKPAVNIAALEQAVISAQPMVQEAIPASFSGDSAENAIYRSPEAYLFSGEDEPLPAEHMLKHEYDVSALVLDQSGSMVNEMEQ